MGVPRGTARLLLDEARQRPFAGTLLELGRASVYVREDELRRWAATQGVPLRAGERVTLSHDPRLAALGCLSDRSFFRLLGFDEVRVLDLSDWEGADLEHDLNQPVPPELAGRFDAVFEAGTLQHVFDLPAALANLHRLLRDGGRVVHGMSTSSNHVDHGFYMFSPTLFHDYYEANGWRIDAEYFFEFAPVWTAGRFESAPWPIRRYAPGCLDHLSYGGFGRRQVGLFTAATKLAGATADVAPQQGYYRRFWATRPRPGEAAASPLETRLAASPRLAPALVVWKRARAALRRLLPRRLPPVAHRY